jgi:hypothetical protein
MYAVDAVYTNEYVETTPAVDIFWPRLALVGTKYISPL